jgi:hypothetical protein
MTKMPSVRLLPSPQRRQARNVGEGPGVGGKMTKVPSVWLLPSPQRRQARNVGEGPGVGGNNSRLNLFCSAGGFLDTVLKG